MLANTCIKFARYPRPTRKGEAPLLAAYARRYGPYMRSVRLLQFVILGVLPACASYRGVMVTEAEPAGCVFRGEIAANQTCNDVMDDLKKKAFQLGGDTLECCWEGEVSQVLMRNRRTGRSCDYLIPYYAKVYSCNQGHNNSLQPIAPKVGAPAE